MWIDIHVHTRIFETPERGALGAGSYATPDELKAMLLHQGVGRVVALPATSPDCAFYRQNTEEVLMAAEQYPDFIIPFMNIDPRQGRNSPETDFSYLINHYKDRGCKGLGEVTANMPFDHPLVENLFKHVEVAGLPLIFHIGPQEGDCYGLIDQPGLPLLEGALRKFPNLRFLGHSQPFWAEISGDLDPADRNTYPKGPVVDGGAVVRLMRQYPNLNGDLSAGSGHNAVSRDPNFGYAFMTEFQDRLFFGTDICDPRNDTPLVDFMTDAVEGGKISREVFEKICWRNAEEMLGLEHA